MNAVYDCGDPGVGFFGTFGSSPPTGSCNLQPAFAGTRRPREIHHFSRHFFACFPLYQVEPSSTESTP